MTLAANDPVPNSKSDTFPKTTQARDRRLENGDELDSRRRALQETAFDSIAGHEKR